MEATSYFLCLFLASAGSGVVCLIPHGGARHDRVALAFTVSAGESASVRLAGESWGEGRFDVCLGRLSELLYPPCHIPRSLIEGSQPTVPLGGPVAFCDCVCHTVGTLSFASV